MPYWSNEFNIFFSAEVGKLPYLSHRSDFHRYLGGILAEFLVYGDS